VKRLLTWLALALCAASLHAANYKLNLFIWSEYIDPEVVAEFEKRYNAKVIIDLYEDEAAMMAKLKGGGAAQYDVIVPPDHTVPALIKLKLIAPLRPANIPNMRHIDPRFASPWYDPSNRFTVPYQWGTLGIYARKPAEPYHESWALLFDAKEKRGSFMFMDSMRDTIGAALKFQGHSFNSTDKKELAAARDLVIDAKKRSLGFAGGVGGKNKVLAKECTMAMAFSGDAARGMVEDRETYYFIPQEGGQIWMDNLAICAQAPNRNVAEKFLDFVLAPEIGAKLADFNLYGTPNKAALAFVRPENFKNPIIYPPPAVMDRLEFLRDLGKDTKLYDEIWTQIKAK
jgi:spermidine/putrescine transport system substrate-binding protein